MIITKFKQASANALPFETKCVLETAKQEQKVEIKVKLIINLHIRLQRYCKLEGMY